MSATYRCDLCKDPDLNATYTMYPNCPVRRHVQGVDDYYDVPDMNIGGTQPTGFGRNYDLCELCRIEYTELMKKFLGSK